MMHVIDNGNLSALVGANVILLWLGNKFAESRQKKWGGFLAILAFLGYCGYAFDRTPPRDAERLFEITVRALVTFGLTLGFSWIVLALLAGVFGPVLARMKADAAKRKVEREIRKQKEKERLQIEELAQI